MEVKIFGQTLKIYTERLTKTKKKKKTQRNRISQMENLMCEKAQYSLVFFPHLLKITQKLDRVYISFLFARKTDRGDTDQFKGLHSWFMRKNIIKLDKKE